MKREIEDRFRLLGGMMPVDNTFLPLSQEELTSVESDLGVELPYDYREFLRAYGAISFGKLVQFRLMQSAPIYVTEVGKAVLYERVPFSHFYGSNISKQSLIKRVMMYKDRMPDTMIPIADDGGGNQICLGIDGKERGNVYYWDHNNEWDEQDYLDDYGEPMPSEVKFQNVYLIAASFEDFILSLEISINL